MSYEDEYFARVEAEKKARLAQLLSKEDRQTEAERLKELHFMHCGKCGTEMFTSNYRGVEIEVCPNCGAVLLDPGELQQLAGDDTSNVFSNLFQMFGFSKD